MLKKLSLKGVGPAPEMEVEFAERLTVITGDNGLGKSFILDAVWFALTETPFSSPIRPNFIKPAEIAIEVYQNGIASIYNNNLGTTETKIIPQWKENHLKYNRQILGWEFEGHISFMTLRASEPVLYQSSSGAIGFYNPGLRDVRPMALGHALLSGTFASVYSFDEIFKGFDGEGKSKHNGLVRDLARWFYEDEAIRAKLECALKILSENEEEPLILLKPERIDINDPRSIPFIQTPGENVPITLASAGIVRVLSLAYMLVWSWEEYILANKIKGEEPSKSMILMIDEIETHLHPKWQRKILAAVLEVAKAITEDEGFQVQVICTTHSPIVLTGIEPHFDPEKDKLLDLQLTPGAPGERGTIELREVDWYKRGTVGNWLTSDMFNVSERSPEAQKAMDEAAALIELPEPDKTKVREVDEKLRNLLPDTDRFLVRWDYICEQRNLLTPPEY